MWRWIVGGVVALLLAFGIAAAIGSDTDIGDGRWNDEGRVERVVNADGSETLVIHDGWDHGFPFGIILIPLVIFGFIAIARGIFGRGPGGGPGRWGGPGGWGYGPPGAYYAGGYGGPGEHANPPAGAGQAPAAPPWFEEWHRRAHVDQSTGPAPAPAPAPNAPAGAQPAGTQQPGVD